MNDEQAKILLGVATGLAFLGILVHGHLIGRPVPDRTLAIFASLLWAYLNVDIGIGLTNILGRQDRGSDRDREDDRRRERR